MAAVVAADGVVDLAAAGLAVAEVVEDLVDLVEEVQVEAVLEEDGRLFIERGKTIHT
jgi:urease gamma subunit